MYMDKSTKETRLCNYKKEREQNNLWFKPVSSDVIKAFCSLYLWEFSIRHGGDNDLSQHASTEMHKKATASKGASNICRENFLFDVQSMVRLKKQMQLIKNEQQISVNCHARNSSRLCKKTKSCEQ
ncbi:hypothetical protein CHARACLAT_022297 [Characodon lateralis]|uniref:Uncharacterized protein n=1 Tax=Characodon lateralis TaxID=208331 RepID=A0ABU7E3X9_9TELE|nr:hypothetical protein [Characodon lateralis]